MQVHKRIHYSGIVQGVGFRATTRSIARRHPVSGYVRNLPNGDVELVVEGLSWQVKAFLDEVEHEMSAHIYGSTVEQGPIEGFSTFVIRD